jgi:hypothetical protein
MITLIRSRFLLCSLLVGLASNDIDVQLLGFLKAHCAEYAFKTTNCFKWKKFFLAHFASLGSALDQIEWDQWLHAPGLPPLPKFDTSLCDEAHKLAAALAMGETAPEEVCLSAWSSARQVAFLEKLLTLQSECKNATEFVPVD